MPAHADLVILSDADTMLLREIDPLLACNANGSSRCTRPYGARTASIRQAAICPFPILADYWPGLVRAFRGSVAETAFPGIR